MSKEEKEKIEEAEETTTPTSETTEKAESNETNGEENSSSENAETEQSDKVAEEKNPLAEAQAEAADWKDKYIRLMAEFDNYRKRVIKEKAELILNGGEKTIEAILPVLDDFERALADKTEDPAAIKEGMDLIFKKFEKTLEGMGVKKIDTTDADFDVDYHEAIAMVPGMGDDKKGKIIDCVQTGYTLNDKVIRHAKVAVGQ